MKNAMMTMKTNEGFLSEIAPVQASLETWRRTRRPRQPIPEALWRQMAALGRQHGVSRVCQALRVGYYALKRRVEGAAHAPEFVEVKMASPVGERSGCTAQMEDRKGRKPQRFAYNVVRGADTFYHAPKLFRELEMARADGSMATLLKKLARTRVLIIDDLGISNVSGRLYREFLEIIDDRQGQGSTIVTSQFPVEKWHEIIGDETVADAILDRLVHNAYRLELKGESIRRIKTDPSDRK
jgi:hypothetical protein